MSAEVLVLAGYLLVHFFEHTLAPHFHFGEEIHGDEVSSGGAGYAALLGLVIDTFSTAWRSSSGCWFHWLGAVFSWRFHAQIPEGYGGVLLMLAIGQSKRAAYCGVSDSGGVDFGGVALMYLRRGR